VALLLQSDRSVLYRCKLCGYQDTLWCASSTSKQLYRECTISGTVDFIFDAAAAVFQNCDIRARMPIRGAGEHDHRAGAGPCRRLRQLLLPGLHRGGR
jgi:pectinesterase